MNAGLTISVSVALGSAVRIAWWQVTCTSARPAQHTRATGRWTSSWRHRDLRRRRHRRTLAARRGRDSTATRRDDGRARPTPRNAIAATMPEPPRRWRASGGPARGRPRGCSIPRRRRPGSAACPAPRPPPRAARDRSVRTTSSRVRSRTFMITSATSAGLAWGCSAPAAAKAGAGGRTGPLPPRARRGTRRGARRRARARVRARPATPGGGRGVGAGPGAGVRGRRRASPAWAGRGAPCRRASRGGARRRRRRAGRRRAPETAPPGGSPAAPSSSPNSGAARPAPAPLSCVPTSAWAGRPP